MDFFSISVSSVSDDYSADYGSVNPYIVDLGTTTSDGSWIVRAPIIGAFAPYTKTKITALNTGSGLWQNNIDWLRFYFNDLYNPVVNEMSKASFISSGVNHTYGPPGTYYFGMVAHTVAGGSSAFYIANVAIGEIPAIPVISIFEEGGDTAMLGTSAYSPYTVYFAATGTVAGSYLPDDLTWNFDDRTPSRTVTRFETEIPQFHVFGGPHVTDPRNYLVPHTYYRKSRVTEREAIFPQLEIRAMVTATTATTATSAEIGPLKHAQAEMRRLIKGRCFGADNKFLMISETGTGQVFQHLILNLGGTRAPIVREDTPSVPDNDDDDEDGPMLPETCECNSPLNLWPVLTPAHGADDVFTTPTTYTFTALSAMCISQVEGFVNPDHSQTLTVTTGPSGTEYPLFSAAQIDTNLAQSPNINVEAGWKVQIDYTPVDPEDPTPWVTVHLQGCTDALPFTCCDNADPLFITFSGISACSCADNSGSWSASVSSTDLFNDTFEVPSSGGGNWSLSIPFFATVEKFDSSDCTSTSEPAMLGGEIDISCSSELGYNVSFILTGGFGLASLQIFGSTGPSNVLTNTLACTADSVLASGGTATISCSA